MKNKPAWKSKTMIAAILSALTGIAQAAGYAVTVEAYAIFGALGLYGLRDAVDKKWVKIKVMLLQE